jgi:predicted O-methyltransferase YrrM
LSSHHRQPTKDRDDNAHHRTGCPAAGPSVDEAEGPASPELAGALAQIPPEERAALSASTSPKDYRGFYTLAKDAYLAVSRDTAELLYILVRATGARSIVEFGTSFGISTLHLAAGLRDNGGGRVITTEFEPSKAARARENFVAGGARNTYNVFSPPLIGRPQCRSPTTSS